MTYSHNSNCYGYYI